MHPVLERVAREVTLAFAGVETTSRDASSVVFHMPQRLDVYLQVGTESDDDNEGGTDGQLFARVSYPLAMGIDSRDYRFEFVRPGGNSVRALKAWEDQVLVSVLAGIEGAMSIAPAIKPSRQRAPR
jgi:hypothetical protein